MNILTLFFSCSSPKILTIFGNVNLPFPGPVEKFLVSF